MKILFFIGTLRSGGKERRLVELLTFLKEKTNIEILVVLRQNLIDYPAFHNLEIPYVVLTKKYKKKDIKLPFKLLKICKSFKPDIIHTWGSMPATVSILSVLSLNICHINSQITSAPPNYKKWSVNNLLNRINFYYSDIILSNSQAGLDVYNPPFKKSKVIYNGVRLERFENLPTKDSIKNKYNISTKYAIVMVASFSKNKNFDLFLNIADLIIDQREDISFVCVGDGINFKRLFDKYMHFDNIIFTGKIDNVESLVNACDIGILISNEKLHGEGISNTLTEYMALKKTVIANDAGGTKEIVKNNENGFLFTKETPSQIAEIILKIIDNPNELKRLGINGRKLIERKFTIERMGKEFVDLYKLNIKRDFVYKQ